MKLRNLDYLALAAARRVNDRAHWLQNLFQAGFNKGATFTPAGGVAAVLNITAWDWGEKIDKVDITHTGTGGVQALLAAILRGTGKVSAFFESAAMPFSNPPNLKPGTNGSITFSLGAPNTQWIIPVMVTELHFQNEVTGGVKYDFTVEMNALAGVNQALVTEAYPT